MAEQDTIQTIAFPKLDDAEIAALGAFTTLKSFKEGEALFEAGEKGFKFFVIRAGKVEIIERSAGEEKIVTVHEPREFTGDIGMLTGRSSFVTALAKGACEVYEVSAEDIKRIINELPTLGERILRAFIARRQLLEASDFRGLSIVGSKFSRDTLRIREFLFRNKVPFTWIDVENDPRVVDLLNQFQISEADTPIVAYGNTLLLKNPSNRELGERIGIKQPLQETVYDLAVVGAGPAGLAAAVYGASEGLNTVVLEATAPGGQAGSSSRIENYLGFPTGVSGTDLANRAVLQAQKFGAQISTPTQVTGLRFEGTYPVLQLDGGESISAKCLLIATGVDYRKLSAAGCARFDGSSIYYAATATEAQMCRNVQIMVVGGGNSAGQAAVFLSEYAKKVWLLIRDSDLRKGMSSYLVRRIEQTKNIELLTHTEIIKMIGDEQLSAVEIRNNKTHETRMLEVSAVFSFIGAIPRTGWLPAEIAVDDRGFIKTGPQVSGSASWTPGRQPYLLETSHPGVFAAGDVRLGSTKRVATAVGEGAMAVSFVHEYLKNM